MRFKSRLIIFLIILSILFTIASVSASDNQTEMLADEEYKSFTDLNQSIAENDTELNLEYNYKYDKVDIVINKSKEYTINGNNHEINGMTGMTCFTVENGNNTVTINNLTFKNCTDAYFMIKSPVIFNNVKFINCTGNAKFNEFFNGYNASLTFNNCFFEMNDGKYTVVISNNNLIINNTYFSGNHFNGSYITVNRGNLLIENSTFADITTNYTIINFKGWNLTVKRSKFLNLSSSLSAGAILGKFIPQNGTKTGEILIQDCIFSNVTSAHDGGAIFFDCDSGSLNLYEPFNIVNTSFINCKSKLGGALANLGGLLTIVDSEFINNTATFEGGAVYTSWSNVNIINSTFTNNKAQKNAGAIYFDMGKLTLDHVNLTNNKVLTETGKAANAIYANDVDLKLLNSNFDNGGVSIYANFASDSKIEKTNKNDDIFLLDNKDYIVSIENEGIKLNLVKNEIVVDKLPSKFDLRDWGWISPVQIQGDNDDCWAFATVASLEASLLKSTGIVYRLSENYVQQHQLRYNPNGDLRIVLTGFAYSGLGYALSWQGALEKTTPYDDRGIIGKADESEKRIHLQDAIIIFGGMNNTETLIKQAIMKYGSVTVQFIDSKPSDGNFTDGNIAVMDHATHFETIIGWDDTYNSSEGNGCWIVKESLAGFSNETYNDDKLMTTDYYAIVPQRVAIAYIFENDIDYHVNYQTDLTALTGFDGNFTHYSNEFVSKYDELIGAVGTYFNESGIDYSFDIYINGAKVHTQSGVSEFAGFRTIVLNKYIPIKTGDKFKVVFNNNALPYQAYSRTHYIPGMTFVSRDGTNWQDITLQNKTVCLKVYTVADDTKIINNKDISVDYDGGSYFSVKVVTSDGRAVGAGAVVKFTINGKTTTVKTDNEGIAKIKISNLPKKYTLTTSYNGKTYENTVTVKQVLTASKVTVKKKTAKKFYIKAKLKINGKLVKGKVIKFKFNGKTYKAKTNKKGIAQVTIKKKIIKKLKKGKKYTVKITYLKDTIKTTVKIK
ncbi:lectin like domain-containing protein [Methanobrevibacter sp.]